MCSFSIALSSSTYGSLAIIVSTTFGVTFESTPTTINSPGSLSKHVLNSPTQDPLHCPHHSLYVSIILRVAKCRKLITCTLFFFLFSFYSILAYRITYGEAMGRALKA